MFLAFEQWLRGAEHRHRVARLVRDDRDDCAHRCETRVSDDLGLEPCVAQDRPELAQEQLDGDEVVVGGR